MKVKAATELLNLLTSHQAHREWDLCIEVFSPGAIGGTPCVPVKAINAGFDWDAGKIIIEAEADLTVLSAKDVADINQSVRAGQSWHAYQAYKKQADRIRELEAEVAALKSA